MEFNNLVKAIQVQFDMMAEHRLFVVQTPKRSIFDAYLKNIAPEDDPIYITNTVHNCDCCKAFIRDVGNVVAIIDNSLVSVWDADVPDMYKESASAMSQLVKSCPIYSTFTHHSATAGTESNSAILSDKQVERLVADGNKEVDTSKVTTYKHFFQKIPALYVIPESGEPQYRSEVQSRQSVFLRAMKEWDLESVNSVKELIDENILPRGEEMLNTVELIIECLTEAEGKTDQELEWWSWFKSIELGGSSRFRNSAIGTLIVDLCKGEDRESSIIRFSKMVSGENYKRPKTTVTQAMKVAAGKTLIKHDLESAIPRRHAVTSDIPYADVLFADRSSRVDMSGGSILDDIVPVKSPAVVLVDDSLVKIKMSDFISDVLPKAESVHVLIKNNHKSNLMSLIAPVNADAGQLFKWDNLFSWSYNGEVADAVAVRVKSAGGVTDAVLRVSALWHNTDDLDIKLKLPSRKTISFSNKRVDGGSLDVDANNGNLTTKPVENIYFSDEKNVVDGNYEFSIHQYCKRNNVNYGFEAEISYKGQSHNFVYDKVVQDRNEVLIAKFTISDGSLVISSGLSSEESSAPLWSVESNVWSKVNMVMNSPNHWGEQAIGNRHWFFIVDQCENPDTVRGMYNEFLNDKLHADRKVFEVVGAQMKVVPADDQLSGLGFSSTLDAVVDVKVTTSESTRVYRVSVK